MIMDAMESRIAREFADIEKYRDFALPDVGIISGVTAKGFGFIRNEQMGDKEVFFHFNKLRTWKLVEGLPMMVSTQRARKGDRVTFDLEKGGEKPRAALTVLYTPKLFDTILAEYAGVGKFRVVAGRRNNQRVLWAGKDVSLMASRFPVDRYKVLDYGDRFFVIEEYIPVLERWVRCKADPRVLQYTTTIQQGA